MAGKTAQLSGNPSVILLDSTAMPLTMSGFQEEYLMQPNNVNTPALDMVTCVGLNANKCSAADPEFLKPSVYDPWAGGLCS
jgi:hypothetical protein